MLINTVDSNLGFLVTKPLGMHMQSCNLTSLAGPTSQFLNGTHEFSEWLWWEWPFFNMDQSRSVLPLRSDKAREFGESRREEIRARVFFT